MSYTKLEPQRKKLLHILLHIFAICIKSIIQLNMSIILNEYNTPNINSWNVPILAKRRITCAADAGELGKRGRQPAKPARGHPLEVGGAGAKRTSFLNVRTPETTAAAGATRKDEDCRCTGSLASTTAHEVAAAAAVCVCRARPLALAALPYGSPVVQASGVGVITATCTSGRLLPAAPRSRCQGIAKIVRSDLDE